MLLFKHISLILFSKWSTVVVSWERDVETYTQGEDFFSYLLLGARGSQCLHPLASRNTSDRLRVPRSTAILCTQSKSDRMVLVTRSPSGYTPVRPECSDLQSSSGLLIKMRQLTKAHGVTRNKVKIPLICYITHSICHKYIPNNLEDNL